ncbi:hypothetical protein MWU75_13360 [Ornithinimicrobium sp. F0845]|uniref:hypothetical protein n=1 Tax=Ornithinimicrobium sp. F0845 TaxID=2926412 RepID=UPI001FF5018D|nr:hypothetical protein [Ornithinimicrobium sp. F0845]MCK0113132.1 hypothetical protein [Ornithinimicrobium sp. F0845]
MKVCIFAGACDAAAAQEVLLSLPADAYGQVYVADDTMPLGAPERVQINRVTSRPGACAMAEALSGWSAEWLPECAAAAGESPTVWVLPGAAAALAAADHESVTRLITVLPSNQLIHG